MTEQLVFSDVPKMEQRLKDRRVSMDTFFRRAKINQSTWHRWRTREFHPRMQTWERACDAYRELVAEPVGAK